MFLNDYVYINNKKISYYESGFGKTTIVFLSGFGTPFAMADMYELATLLQAKCRCVIIDRFGYGNSDVVDTDRNLINISNEIKQIFKALDINPKNVILVGHSIASFYAMYINKELKLKGLVLIDSQKITNFKLFLTKFVYNIYFSLSKTFVKKLFDGSTDKMFERSIPSKLKVDGKQMQREKIPNESIKSELKCFCDELKYFENNLQENSLSKAILVCRNETVKYNESIKNKFKEAKILNVGKAEHYIHYSHFYLITKEILSFFKI